MYIDQMLRVREAIYNEQGLRIGSQDKLLGSNGSPDDVSVLYIYA